MFESSRNPYKMSPDEPAPSTNKPLVPLKPTSRFLLPQTEPPLIQKYTNEGKQQAADYGAQKKKRKSFNTEHPEPTLHA